MKQTLILFFILIFYQLLNAQGGVQLHGAILSGKNNLAGITPSGTAHGGYRIGADIRLGDDDMYFLPGLHYKNFAFNSHSSIQFFGNQASFQVWKGRLGFGFSLWDITEILMLRARLQASLSYISNISEGTSIPSPYEKFNNGYAGIDLGIGVDILNITIDLEYERGIVNAVYQEKESTFNFWTLSVGVFF